MTIPTRLASDSEVIDFMSDYCEFGAGRVYILSIMARPRENDAINHGSVPMFREILTEAEDIERKYHRLKNIAQTFTPDETEGDETLDFRMYLSANARDVEKAYHQFQKHLLDLKQKYSQGHEPAMEKMERLDREWESQLQSDGNKDDSYFVIDIDTESEEILNRAIDILEEDTTIQHSLKSPNGFHIIVEPFGYPQSDIQDLEDAEIKKDSLMFLTMFD